MREQHCDQDTLSLSYLLVLLVLAKHLSSQLLPLLLRAMVQHNWYLCVCVCVCVCVCMVCMLVLVCIYELNTYHKGVPTDLGSEPVKLGHPVW